MTQVGSVLSSLGLATAGQPPQPGPIYKIHPPIGVARVGNAPYDEFFIGPELPGVGPTGSDAGSGHDVPSVRTPSGPGVSYKDAAGRIRRQAARFRIWEYTWDPVAKGYAPNREIHADLPEVKQITWTVQLANRKASFFEFNGTNGERPPYSNHTAPFDPFQDDVRNGEVSVVAGIPNHPMRRLRLDIDPAAEAIHGKSAAPKTLTKTKPDVPLGELGQLRTDNLGRLLVLGGEGKAEASGGLPRSAAAGPHPVVLRSYANNETWFDDVSDGPVTAKIEFNAKPAIEAEDVQSAWVLVGPPDFAPPIANLVSLYDTILDVTVQHLTLPTDDAHLNINTGALRRVSRLKAEFRRDGASTAYRASFLEDVFPILLRLRELRWVHEPVFIRHWSFDPILATPYWDWARLSNFAGPKVDRAEVFRRLRTPEGMTRPVDPAIATPAHLQNMPRLLGDEEQVDANRPHDSSPGNPKEFLALTSTQYFALIEWLAGNFDRAGWPAGNDPAALVPHAPFDFAGASPVALDRAALESCVGGAFFPGIEVSWLVRQPALYRPERVPAGPPNAPPISVFRLDPWRRNAATGAILKVGAQWDVKEIQYGIGPGSRRLRFEAGFFSQQMAQPWQADFVSCAQSDHGGQDYGWWPAQRPDVVFRTAADVPSAANGWALDRSVGWYRGLGTRETFIANLTTRGFVVDVGGNLLEQGGPP